MNNIKIIVFDLYNTLIEIKESNHFFFKLYKTSQNGFDLDLSSYFKLVMKNDINELKNILPIEFSILYDENKNDLEKELNSIIIYEEVFNVLRDLISNLASPYKKPFFLNNLDSFFEKMIFSCDFGSLKPDQTVFKEIEKISGSKPSEILMVGDSFKSDILGAQNMKWHYLKINRCISASKEYEITTLKDIKQHITIY
ncbi:HAD family hydrolase [uncultured Tenacibaculum sp.]|uniref:HAD family hydrolase n=1 Tax=uncultured Tenacibaculum sp. TaxID=174713 RepID=UPI00262A49DD|nr:HAD family hydrolase [uncultured Tenacibaculum sp.]